ncbi:MAG: hypothetical protein IPF53_10645 [Blastocatellia bacterium]|nr:hypothetical protein [Blastocatellia bacterium]
MTRPTFRRSRANTTHLPRSPRRSTRLPPSRKSTRSRTISGSRSIARAAVNSEASRQSFSAPLPSGRPWPGQFAAARKQARSTLDFYEGLAVHIDRRAETALKTKDERDFVLVETDIRNVTRTAAESLATFKEYLVEMQRQRDAKTWTYGPAPRKAN